MHKIGPYLYISSYPYLVGIFVIFRVCRRPIRRLKKKTKKSEKKGDCWIEWVSEKKPELTTWLSIENVKKIEIVKSVKWRARARADEKKLVNEFGCSAVTCPLKIQFWMTASKKNTQPAVHAFQCFYSGQCIKYKIVLHTHSAFQWTKPIKSLCVCALFFKYRFSWCLLLAGDCVVLTDHFFRTSLMGSTRMLKFRERKKRWMQHSTPNNAEYALFGHTLCIFTPFFPSTNACMYIYSIQKRMNV